MPGKLVGRDVENALSDAVQAPLGLRKHRNSINEAKACILSTHDEAFSKQDVLVAPKFFKSIPGEQTILQITAIQDVSASSPPERGPSGRDGSTKPRKFSRAPEYVCILREAGQDVLSRMPTLEISILTPIAKALGFRSRAKVVVKEVQDQDYCASHVEIAFKDAFLTRADLWRLLTSDLVGTSIYKGQRVLFINSVKATIKAIYVKGRKMQSAVLSGSTKAIFRSESSSYIIMLQMSKEMWDFDADGGGEIMFNKVINGFLPELFRRWEALGTTHTVSVVLFTRMLYEDSGDGIHHQDYYRVLTTELTSGESEVVLQGLKREFKTFLRDVSVTQPSLDENGECVLGPGQARHGNIRGKPAPAINGNILEAIHTASLQFLRSNVTCDLRRTGLSLIVITPGTGVFEVSQSLLAKATDLLIENGIYIDLVCLSQMPLHSSPLFKYQTGRKLAALALTSTDVKPQTTAEWQYAIPHWVDVSFWEDKESSDRPGNLRNIQKQVDLGVHRPFLPRVRMYEIQMMGIMQNEFSISMPYLPPPPISARIRSHTKQLQPPGKGFEQEDSDDLEGAKAVYNQGNHEPGTFISPSKTHSSEHDRNEALFTWMGDQDEKVYSRQQNQEVHQPVITEVAKDGTTREDTSDSKEITARPVHAREKAPSHVSALLGMTTKRKASSASTTSQPRSISGKSNPISRQLSYNFMGFGAAKPTPTTSISTGSISVQASADRVSMKAEGSGLVRQPSSQVMSIDHEFSASSTLPRPSTRSSILTSAPSIPSLSGPSTPQPEQNSKPIDIRPSTMRSRTEVSRALEPKLSMELSGADEEDLEASADKSYGHEREKSPWMTVLNPSNPKHLTADLTNRLGRWQHVFPKPAQTSTIKWKSLCSPAVLPLTTEDFPSREQLLAEFAQSRYVVSASQSKEPREAEKRTEEWLVRELIGSRLTRGFSVVVGSRPADALGLPKAQWYEFLHEKGMSQEGVKVVMSRGKEIHELMNQGKGIVAVTRYLHTSMSTAHQRSKSEYAPLVKTAYASHYVERQFSFISSNDLLDWERLDQLVARNEEEANKPLPESVQYWRARFVLIPVAVSGGRSRHRTAEDSEEEVRLEGIRKLTQMWQKNRYLSPDERKFESSDRTKKDVNPLDLVYQTRSASAIVSELNDTILVDGHDQRDTQLLREKELFEKAKLNLTALAKAMQGDQGVRLLDRRWHWRLHYNCFIGLEFVTWLVSNFRDIDIRDEAVELGNDLMKEGLFVHVEKRHNFRDGNFFYQITEKYRTPRNNEPKNWLSRLADRSIPPTPMTESSTEDMRGLRSVASLDSAEGEQNDIRSDAEQPSKASVVLSKQLVYDIDHRGKSHRRELVNLHVDRISSVDDCYHIRIDWVTATPKLIEDTVETWASIAERSGLRLVEVPLLEACRVREQHPFRHPYLLKLVKDPPSLPPRAIALENGKPVQHGGARWPYQKAILKKFDFVLDLEAADDFPPSVDVSYSWGKPDYRYAQYITRNGRLLAQITDDGHFLLVINQLFSERGFAAREAQRAAGKEGARSSNAAKVFEVHTLGLGGVHYYSSHSTSTSRAPHAHSNNTNTSSPLASNTPTAALGKIMSPFASPMLKAAGTGTASPRSSPHLAGREGVSKSEMMTLEEFRDEFEAFTSDEKALEKFYDEEMHRPPATVPATPLMHPVMLGLSAVTEESNLPTFSLKT